MNTTFLSMLLEANQFKDNQISSLENLIKSMSKCNEDLIEENISLKEEIEKYKKQNKDMKYKIQKLKNKLKDMQGE